MPIEITSSVSVSPSVTALAQAPVTAKSSSGAAASSGEQHTTYTNPSSYLDPELHMVILEFRNASGQITESLPTTQQIEQFRQDLTAARSADSGKAAAPSALKQWG